MGEDCPHCVFEKTEANCQGCFEGSHYRPKPITNYDRLRAKSVEAMAEFMAQQEYRKPVFDGWLPLCYHAMGPRMCHENGCEKCWLDWLKQEAAE